MCRDHDESWCHSTRHSPIDHNAAGQPDGNSGTNGSIHGGGDGHGATDLSVEEEWDRDQRCNFDLIYNTSDNEFGQRSAVHRDSQQLGGQCDQQRGHPHGQRRCGGTFDHNAAGQPDGNSGTNGSIHGGGDGHGAADLSVEEERDRDQRRNFDLIYNTSDNEFEQRSAVHRDSQQLGGQCDQQRGHPHGQRRCGGTFDHNAAGQPDGNSGTNGSIHSGGDGHGTTDLSVEEERDSGQRRNIIFLYNPSDNEFGQRSAVHRDSQQLGGQCDQQRGHTQGQRRCGGTFDHNAAGQPDGNSGTNGSIHGGGDGHGAADLSVEEERDRDQRRNFDLIYNTSDNEFEQRSAVHRDSQQLGGQCDQQRGHPHGQRRCGGTFDHNAAGQPDGNSGTNGSIH